MKRRKLRRYFKRGNEAVECTAVQEQLSCYLDGELASAESRRVGEHLKECPTCAQEYESLRRMTQMIGQMHQQPPAGMWAQIEERLKASPPPKRQIVRLAPLWKPLAVAALLLLAFGIYFWKDRSTEEMPLEYYLEAHAAFAVTTPFTPDTMVAFVLPQQGDTSSSDLWESDTDSTLESYLEAYY